MWELAKLELPTNKELEDLTPQCWQDHVDWILRDQVARAKVKAADGKVVFTPMWLTVLEYELEVRRKAVELVNTKGKTLAAALVLARDDEKVHRQFFVMPTALSAGVEAAVAASSSSSRSVPQFGQEVAAGGSQASFLKQLEKTVQDVANQAVQQALKHSGRSTGPNPKGG